VRQALGSRRLLGLLRALPTTPVARVDEALAFIERRALVGRGIGWVDVQLLASALLAGTRIWTLDRRLAAVAADLGVAAEIEG
jgi:predicted nucleic acid-binding protein